MLQYFLGREGVLQYSPGSDGNVPPLVLIYYSCPREKKPVISFTVTFLTSTLAVSFISEWCNNCPHHLTCVHTLRCVVMLQ